MIKIKNFFFITIFIGIAMLIIFNFKDYNVKKAIDACLMGAIKLNKLSNLDEAKKFCEDKIKKNKNIK
ncbi:MAG: hypothetical protein EXR14_02190 [Pelagibacteraceae bacterium]|nr:hypothetical protein [Pelagibacteraceae bacterium]PHX89346.1 MAG: hypothetical protein CK535_01920 [Pelagibacteraceae bacterium]